MRDTRKKSDNTHRLTRKQKNAKDQQWYKDELDKLDVESLNNSGYGGISEYKRIKVNSDLFNNIVDLSDFEYVCTPYGAEVGELPANMTNKDISSYRIKALHGMELKTPLNYKVIATNREATTRREEEETNRIREYVIDSIMSPIRQQIEAKYQEEMKGGKLSPNELQELQQKMQQEIVSQTPDRIRRYMQRKHQDPAEVMGHQIMQYLTKELDLKRKFAKGWKYSLLSAYEIYWVGIVNGKPMMKVINPIRFNYDKSPDLDFIEDGSWAVAEFRMTPSDVANQFELTDAELDKIFENTQHYASQQLESQLFKFDDQAVYQQEQDNTIRVIHGQWKALRKIGWLTYVDEAGELQTKFLVDEEYKLNVEAGDISIEWEWIPEVYEGYKIGTDIYKEMKPVVGQFKDEQRLRDCKLSYHGVAYDNENSQPTSFMDRMKVYQYYYNIVMYRIELLMASDKGKKILMNVKAIPESAGIDIEKWQYFFESSPFMWYSDDEEGMDSHDVNTIAKAIDLSLASDIDKYIRLAEYLEEKCGKSVGVTDPVLGQTAVSDSVGNNQQNLIQTSYILEPYFSLHETVKKNVMNSILEVAKIAYTSTDEDMLFLDYIMDDMSRETLRVDVGLLSNSTLGIFFENGSDTKETKDFIKTLAHAYAQNQAIEMSDVLAVIREDSVQEAEEVLRAGEAKRQEREAQQAEAERKARAEEEQRKRDHEEQKHKWEIDKIVTKEEEKRKTDIQKQAMLSIGFNENKDFDNDGQLDVLEVAKNSIDADIRLMNERREDRKLDHQIEKDRKDQELEKEKIKASNKAKSK